MQAGQARKLVSAMLAAAGDRCSAIMSLCWEYIALDARADWLGASLSGIAETLAGDAGEVDASTLLVAIREAMEQARLHGVCATDRAAALHIVRYTIIQSAGACQCPSVGHRLCRLLFSLLDCSHQPQVG